MYPSARSFSSGENFRRVRRRMVRTAASVDCFFEFVMARRSPDSKEFDPEYRLRVSMVHLYWLTFELREPDNVQC